MTLRRGASRALMALATGCLIAVAAGAVHAQAAAGAPSASKRGAARAPAQPRVAAPVVPAERWLQGLQDQVWIPGYAELASRSAQLAQCVEAFCADPGVPSRDAARDAWRLTVLQWRELSAMARGPARERRFGRNFDFRPARPALIDKAIAELEQARAQRKEPSEVIAQTGAAARGLQAIEWLLFTDAPADRTPARCEFVLQLTQQLREATGSLASAWQAAPRPDATTGDESRAATAEAMNLPVGSIEHLRTRELARPAASTARASPFTGAISRSTRAQAQAAFAGIERALTGSDAGSDAKDSATEASGLPGLDDVLLGYGHMRIAAQLRSRTGAARAAVAALPQQSARLTPAQVAPAVKALTALQRLLEADAASALQVMIGFSESDSD